MGVDYSANFGIGFKILEPENREGLEEYDFDMDEYVYDLVEDEYYFIVETGSENYGGDSNEYFICVDEPFKRGYSGLQEKVEDLEEFLNEKNVNFINGVDVVGGLNIH